MTELGWLLQDAADVPASDAWLGEDEIAEFRALRSDKRRGDWRVGRWAAKRALAAWFGWDEDVFRTIEIRHDAEGAPSAHRWGEMLPARISISHRAGFGLAAVAPAAVPTGCDMEVSEPRSPAFVAQFLTEAERALVAKGPGKDLATLIWSAKESALKARGTGLRIDTRRIEVSLPAAPDEGPWRPMVVRIAGAAWPFRGWWRREGRWLLTFVTSSPTPPPLPLPRTP